MVRILSELRQRRLVQIVLSYLAAGWVTLEVLNTLVERGLVPEVTYLVALIWYLGGIPAAFLVGWHHGEKGRQRAPRSEVFAMSVIAIAATTLSSFTVLGARTAAVDLAGSGFPLSRIAVLYFDEAPAGPESGHLADGLTEALIDELGAVPTLDVISRNGVAPFRGADVSRDSIARTLQAGTLVHGTLERRGDRVQVSVQLYEGSSGAPFPDGRITLPAREASELLQLRDQLVEEVALALRRQLGQEVRLKQRARAGSLEAWVLLQRGERALRDAENAAHHDLHDALPHFQRADELFAHAAAADTSWAEPHILRAELQYRLSRLRASDDVAAATHIEAGVQHADRALAVQPRTAEAYDVRGRLVYWKHLLNVTPDTEAQRALREQGRKDLEEAVRLNPRLATAHSALSHLYYGESLTDGLVAAQRAYEADAYLDAADAVLWRLYSGNYDLQNWARAREWCATGARRFPDRLEFAYCQLELLTSPAVAPDPDQAWRLAARIDSLAPPERRAFESVQARMSVAGVLGRAARAGGAVNGVLLDSARNVLDRARADLPREIDLGEDLIWHEAYMRILTDQRDDAIRLLGQVILANPDHAFGSGGEVWWGWRELESHPGFPALRRAGH